MGTRCLFHTIPWIPVPCLAHSGARETSTKGGPASHRHGVPVSREGVQVLAALGLPNENELAAVTRGLWRQGQWPWAHWPWAPTMCPHLSPTPGANPALPGTCHRRRWPCRGHGYYGRRAAPRHPSWLEGSHEASVHFPHSLTPRGKRDGTGTQGRTVWQPPSRAAWHHGKTPGLRSEDLV